MSRQDNALVERFGEVADFPDLRSVVNGFAGKNNFAVEDSCFDPNGEWALVSYEGAGNLVSIRKGGIYPLGGFDLERDRFDEPTERKFKRSFYVDGVLGGEHVTLEAGIYNKQVGKTNSGTFHEVDWENAEVTTTAKRRDESNYWLIK